MATLFAVVTAYSLLFGLLSWLQLRSVWAFLAIVVYCTAVAASQWTMFRGRHPFWAACLISNLFCAAAVALFGVIGILGIFPLSLLGLLIVTPYAFIGATMLGFGVGGMMDITLLVIEIVGGMDRRILLFPEIAARSTAPRISPRMRRAGLTLLVIVFLCALFMTASEICQHQPLFFTL
jgi:hypothetical protein